MSIWELHNYTDLWHQGGCILLSDVCTVGLKLAGWNDIVRSSESTSEENAQNQFSHLTSLHCLRILLYCLCSCHLCFHRCLEFPDSTVSHHCCYPLCGISQQAFLGKRSLFLEKNNRFLLNIILLLCNTLLYSKQSDPLLIENGESTGQRFRSG